MGGMLHSRNFWRLFGTYGLLVLSSIGVLGKVLVDRVEEHFLQQTEESLRARAIVAREAVREHVDASRAVLQERLDDLRRRMLAQIAFFGENGQILVDTEGDSGQESDHDTSADPEIHAARRKGVGMAVRRHQSFVQREMMYVALRTNASGGPVAFVRVGLPLDHIREQIRGMRYIVWTTAALTAGAAMLLAFWLAQRSAKPLQELTRGAGRIARGEYGTKVYAVSHDEVGTLARTFNAMSEHLAEQFTQLEDDRQKLRAVLSSMVEGVLALDDDERILFTNDRAGLLLGFDAAAAVGRRFLEIVRQRAIHDIVDRVLSGPATYTQELDGTGFSARSLTVQAARLTGPTIRGVVLVFHDTTELRRLERLRQEFVANVSHELKTPLAVIKACIETLLDGAGDNPEDRTGFLQQVNEQAEHLHELIVDLLSLARIESGAESFAFQDVALDELCIGCVERHRARAESRNQTLKALSSEKITAWADPDALNQVIDNLVDNALKYTPVGGTITVRWWFEDDVACFEVKDDGIGIPEADLPRVFERFYRVDKARSRELGGTGLGLSIVKHLVQAQHGSIHAASQPGHGTTFHVRLPYSMTSCVAATNAPALAAIAVVTPGERRA